MRMTPVTRASHAPSGEGGNSTSASTQASISADGRYVCLVPRGPHDFPILMRVIGRPEVVENPRYHVPITDLVDYGIKLEVVHRPRPFSLSFMRGMFYTRRGG